MATPAGKHVVREWWCFICWKAINYIVMINLQMSIGKRDINNQVGDDLETVPPNLENQIATTFFEGLAVTKKSGRCQ